MVHGLRGRFSGSNARCFVSRSDGKPTRLLRATLEEIHSHFTRSGTQAGIMRDATRGPVNGIVESHPERVRAALDALDLDYPGLEAVREASEADDLLTAGRELVEYYRDGDTAEWLRSDAIGDGDEHQARAEPLLENEFTFQGVTGKVPTANGGGIDWEHRGPNDDVEWAYFLNRHGYFEMLLTAYRETGNDRYAAAFDRFIRDWVTANPPPEEEIGRPTWRTLEVGIRLGNAWPTTFYGFQPADAFTPAGRLLMLSVVPAQIEYLVDYHKRGSNWTTMELSGVARAAVCWPEFAGSDRWFEYARDVLTAELDDQVYPDGAQDELTAMYHMVALRNFESFRETARNGDRELPDAFLDTLESMWNYLAYSVRPDGAIPLNNDADRNDIRDALRRAAERYDRPDWLYVLTNGRTGDRPDDPPSRWFEWAGQLVSRSGWSEDAHWSFFDIGPWGTGHQHNDKLHLSISAGGRDLLVDAGRFAYTGELAERFRGEYARHSRGHNVVLIDGAGQRPGPNVVETPLTKATAIEEGYDAASHRAAMGFEELEGQAVHERAVCYRRGRYWVVLDRIHTDRPRTIQPLWHFHPDCTVEIDGEAVRTIDDDTNLRVTPTASTARSWSVEVVEGREPPAPQGWYSERYNQAEPAPTAVYETDIEETAKFAWVLVPGAGTVSRPSIEWTQDGDLRIQVGATDPDEIRVHAENRLELETVAHS